MLKIKPNQRSKSQTENKKSISGWNLRRRIQTNQRFKLRGGIQANHLSKSQSENTNQVAVKIKNVNWGITKKSCKLRAKKDWNKFKKRINAHNKVYLTTCRIS